MNTCKTCKWWGVDYEGACDFVNIPHKEETRFEIRVTADDDQGLHAELMTGPEFGCIHHTK